ncbi:EAL domain-containing response regulator [Bradyrhizobium roseum]|uniref:EAL domain-containing response regulator n=1 Tax=Bradyrhizobium roseum TaxID=3056648 RepID=UPI0026166AC7|nr:EAL domain-containing response regulator [Bradyrhizobium roseus]WKA29937.1 EAL domain-containing response regulator [Bradyrhizobium roseus]
MTAIEHRTDELRGRLLVVEDDLVQRTIIGSIGAKLGYDTMIASTFEIASQMLRDEKFDMMTLDLSLGERDGVELLRLIAALKLNAMPIVIVSGCEERVRNTIKRVAAALNLSLTTSLAKPLNIDKLRAALKRPALLSAAAGSQAQAPTISRDRIVAALRQKEFLVELQPKIDLRTNEICGAEALARWLTPEFGMVSPAIFVPLVEEFGLMSELTHAVCEAAVATSRGLIQQRPGFTVAVNVSASDLSDLTLPERIDGVLRTYEVAPEALIIEVTESIAMSDVDRAMDVVSRLRLKGMGAAIDDFGTGFSSLSALAKLPFSELKIDRSFVGNCANDRDMMKIVEASIALAKAFGMKVVAEGIDNQPTLSALRAAGCDIGQGYLFAPALGIRQFSHLMKRWDPRAAGRFPAFRPPSRTTSLAYG